MLSYSPKEQAVKALLYESFLLHCGLERYEQFYASLGEGLGATSRFLGQRCSPAGDEASIRKSLDLIDCWCRLRLPDKFLEAVDRLDREGRH